MTIRTTRTSITFTAPFHLPGFDILPAGTYAVDTDEEAFEGNVRTIYGRVATTLRIPTNTGMEHYPVDPGQLEGALERDRAAARAMVATPLRPSDASPVDAPAPAPASWRWVPLWVRTSPADGKG